MIPGCNISHFLITSHPRSQSIQKPKSSRDESLPCSEVTACTGLCLPLTEGVCEAFRGPKPHSRQKSESLKRVDLQAQVHAQQEGAPGCTWGPNAQALHSHYHILYRSYGTCQGKHLRAQFLQMAVFETTVFKRADTPTHYASVIHKHASLEHCMSSHFLQRSLSFPFLNML